MKIFLVTKTKIIWGLSALAASLLAFIFTFFDSFIVGFCCNLEDFSLIFHMNHY